MFLDRKDAGFQLAEKLFHYSDKPNTIVLALPRGGVPVAHEIAKKLNLPLDIFLVRKVGVPGNEEVAMGALALGGTLMLNNDLIRYLGVEQETTQAAVKKAQDELEYRNKLYRQNRPALELRGRNIILVDDGMATGATMQVVVMALKKIGVHEIVIAVPVSSDSAFDELKDQVDQVISLLVPPHFTAVGNWYKNFSQVSHAEVRELLK